MSQFLGKSVLITGASGGLGQQLAVDFAHQGAKVTLNYSSSQAAADKVVDQIKQAGGQAFACYADISRAKDVKAMVGQTVDSPLVRELFSTDDLKHVQDKVIFRVNCAKVGFWQIDLRLNCALTAGSREQVVPEPRGKQPCSGGRLKCL